LFSSKIPDESRDDSAERGANDHGDCQIHDIAAREKGLKSLHTFPPLCIPSIEIGDDPHETNNYAIDPHVDELDVGAVRLEEGVGISHEDESGFIGIQ
jgi:hypothetical protein